jgi:hypothetical protein
VVVELDEEVLVVAGVEVEEVVVSVPLEVAGCDVVVVCDDVVVSGVVVVAGCEEEAVFVVEEDVDSEVEVVVTGVVLVLPFNHDCNC